MDDAKEELKTKSIRNIQMCMDAEELIKTPLNIEFEQLRTSFIRFLKNLVVSNTYINIKN